MQFSGNKKNHTSKLKFQGYVYIMLRGVNIKCYLARNKTLRGALLQENNQQLGGVMWLVRRRSYWLPHPKVFYSCNTTASSHTFDLCTVTFQMVAININLVMELSCRAFLS